MISKEHLEEMILLAMATLDDFGFETEAGYWRESDADAGTTEFTNTGGMVVFRAEKLIRQDGIVGHVWTVNFAIEMRRLAQAAVPEGVLRYHVTGVIEDVATKSWSRYETDPPRLLR